MVSITPLKYKDLIKRLRKLGFVFRRATGGTHEIWWNEKTRRTCVIPHHKEIKIGTVRSILKQIQVSADEFFSK